MSRKRPLTSVTDDVPTATARLAVDCTAAAAGTVLGWSAGLARGRTAASARRIWNPILFITALLAITFATATINYPINGTSAAAWWWW